VKIQINRVVTDAEEIHAILDRGCMKLFGAIYTQLHFTGFTEHSWLTFEQMPSSGTLP
jgi:hypothetical protein